MADVGKRTTRPPLPVNASPILLPDGVIEVDKHGHVIGQAVRHCTDLVHVFGDYGECQCGARVWESPVPDSPPSEEATG